MEKKKYVKPDADMLIFFSEDDITELKPLELGLNALSQAFYGEEISLLQ